MELLKGKPVAQWIDDNTQKTAEELMGEGIVPTLAILRVGNKGSDVAYESSAVKKAQGLGIHVEKFILDEKADESDVMDIVQFINDADIAHGLLRLRASHCPFSTAPEEIQPAHL